MDRQTFMTMGALEEALESRGVRIRAFYSQGTWKVILQGNDDGDSFAGNHRRLREAISLAVAHCDQRRAARHPQGVL